MPQTYTQCAYQRSDNCTLEWHVKCIDHVTVYYLFQKRTVVRPLHNIVLLSIRVHLVLRFYTVSWSYFFDGF